MEEEQGYWVFTEDGWSYRSIPRQSHRSAEKPQWRWFRNSFWIFLVLAGLYTCYWLAPFPHVEIGGFVLHP
jgi:hypothetical protein